MSNEILLDNTIGRNSPAPLAYSKDIEGGEIFAADLAALQGYTDLQVLKVGQFGRAADTGKVYTLTTKNTGSPTPHVWTEFTAGGDTIQLNIIQKFVSPAGDDSYNGQINRKKLTIENALASMDTQSSADVDCEDGIYAETLTFGTARSRRTIRGTKGSDRVVINRTWTFNENCQQTALIDLKFDNATGYCIDVNSTLGGFKFDGINIGGNVTDPVCIRVRSGGSGFITIINGDFAGKVIQLDNTVTPRYLYLNRCVNAFISAGTGWIVIRAIDCQNIFEISSNNNILSGWMANSVLTNSTEYAAIVALGAAGNGYYLCNYTEAGVFNTGDVILRINPNTVVDHKYYNANDVYYVISTLRSYFKKSGAWQEIASITDINNNAPLQSNIAYVDQVNGNNTTGKVGNLSKPFLTWATADAAITAIGDESSTNRYAIKFSNGRHVLDTLLLQPFRNLICDSPNGARIYLSALEHVRVSPTFATTADAETLIQNLTFETNTSFGLSSYPGLAGQAAKIILDNCTYLGTLTFYGRNYSGTCPDQLVVKQSNLWGQFVFDCGTLENINSSCTAAFMAFSNLGNTTIKNHLTRLATYTSDGNSGTYTTSNIFITSYVSTALTSSGVGSLVRSDATSLCDIVPALNNGAPNINFDVDRASQMRDNSSTGTNQLLSNSLDTIRANILAASTPFPYHAVFFTKFGVDKADLNYLVTTGTGWLTNAASFPAGWGVVTQNDCYMIATGVTVTDNDPTKTNTGQTITGPCQVVADKANFTWLRKTGKTVSDPVSSLCAAQYLALQYGATYETWGMDGESYNIQNQYYFRANLFAPAANLVLAGQAFPTYNNADIRRLVFADATCSPHGGLGAGGFTLLRGIAYIRCNSVTNSTGNSNTLFSTYANTKMRVYADSIVGLSGTNQSIFDVGDGGNSGFIAKLNVTANKIVGRAQGQSPNCQITVNTVDKSEIGDPVTDGIAKVLQNANMDDIMTASSNKTCTWAAEFSATFNDYRVDTVASGGTTRLSFRVPYDLAVLSSVKIRFFVATGTAKSGRDIDLSVSYCSPGQLYNQYTNSDSTSTYDLSAYANKLYELNATALFANLAAGMEGTIVLATNAVDGSIYLRGVNVNYTC